MEKLISIKHLGKLKDNGVVIKNSTNNIIFAISIYENFLELK